MAELTAFGYHPRDSILHALDSRFKLLFLIILSLSSLNLDLVSLGMITTVLLGAILFSGLPLYTGLKELRYFLILLVLVFLARALSTDGQALLSYKSIIISRQGLYAGVLICWRLILIVLLGFMFVSTTRTSEIKAAVQWYLKPVPFISEQKVAVMMGLILRFVPVIFDQAKETLEAQKARCVQNRKNPYYRLIKLGFPLMRRTFESADDLVAAMEARGYRENRTDPELTSSWRDWLAAMIVGSLCGLIIML